LIACYAQSLALSLPQTLLKTHVALDLVIKVELELFMVRVELIFGLIMIKVELVIKFMIDSTF
jgi:uncharacterized membrane protein YGL010W